MRPSKRAADEMRKVTLERGVVRYAEGSCMVTFGETRVLCAATVEEKGPPWLRGTGKGWVTAEYAMLPRATHERTRREVTSGKPSGRTQEIQRLVGRSLRAVVDLTAIGERQIVVDCDVLQADGGTRTASITGAYVAMMLALKGLKAKGLLAQLPPTAPVAAVSVGVFKGEVLVDLDYAEDSAAEVDLNIVGLSGGRLVEVQGTAERGAFDRPQLDAMLDAGSAALEGLFLKQRAALS